ncbi:MAG: asparagine synthase (glutamine-hydrolyzing) [Gammaproteobacteria bacterium]|nr:asparagine synthase (glutamine-hydrolyzing) [Gammaproteobacteria bacterium]
MCGIAGFYGPWEQDLLHAMNSAQRHRGPDGEGVFHEAGVGLAHVRLSILDLSSAADQPMQSRNGRWVLSYNGEIYNFRELRDELESQGSVFESTGDTEVLLQGLMRWGDDFLSRLNGIFAFALWDRESKKMLLARDQLGVKPLYYSQLSSGLVFASEIKAQLACRDIPRDLDPIAVDQYVAHLWSPGDRTMLSKVKKLQPGEALWIADGHIERRWFYYDIPYGSPLRTESEASLVDELRNAVEQAVRRQMVSDVPIGAFLSGGVDSSAVVAMMCRHTEPSELPCYSIGFRGEEIEGSSADLPFARKVARKLGVDLRPIIIEPDAISNLQRMLYHLDEPQADPAPVNALLIAEQARRDNLKVLLSGTGGDDLFSGYRRHLALRGEKYWTWLPCSVRRRLANVARSVSNGKLNFGLADKTVVRRLLKAFAYADRDAQRRLTSYFLWSTEGLRTALYSADLKQSLAHHQVEQTLLDTLARLPDTIDPLDQMLYLETKHFLADHNLNYMDKTGMAAGIEVRVPLIDRELVRLAAETPASIKIKAGVTKAHFKKAMQPLLPAEVVYRSKTGFGAPLRSWLRHELKHLVDELLSDAVLRERGLFDPVAVGQLVQKDRKGQVDGAHTIFSLMCIELWCRIFTDHEVPQY